MVTPAIKAKAAKKAGAKASKAKAGAKVAHTQSMPSTTSNRMPL